MKIRCNDEQSIGILHEAHTWVRVKELVCRLGFRLRKLPAERCNVKEILAKAIKGQEHRWLARAENYKAAGSILVIPA